MLSDLAQNLLKINEHEQRASRIVRGVLEHPRQGSAERRPMPVKALVQESLALAYQGARAKARLLNAELATELALDLPKAEAMPAELGRVLLNL